MTNFTKNLIVGAAALVVAAGAASAESLKADIPFAFQVGGKTMPAGTYLVSNIAVSSTGVLRFTDKGGGSAVVMPRNKHDARKEWKLDGSPRLAFECGASGCALIEAWDGTGNPAYGMSRPKTVDMETHIAVVLMRPDKGD
ncbi:MAG TPA: hypothetical protein VE959_06235 [Bryobacteraceae bacterium]|nr:hypothetical protein [Bryobacteraceae bacterium]